MLLDHFIMTFAIMIIAAPAVVYDMMQMFDNPGAQSKIFLGNLYVNVFAFSLYFNKDCFLGRSPAKRILKLQVVNVSTNKPVNPVRCLIRNLTIFLWPIEVIFALINNERRLGDFIAGTKLTSYDAEQHKSYFNWGSILLAVIISMLFTYLVAFYPMELLMHFSNP